MAWFSLQCYIPTHTYTFLPVWFEHHMYVFEILRALMGVGSATGRGISQILARGGSSFWTPRKEQVPPL